MKCGPPGAIGRGRAPSDPLPSPRSMPLPSGPQRARSPGRPWHASCRPPSAPCSEETVVCGGRGWARGAGRDGRTQVCEGEGHG